MRQVVIDKPGGFHRLRIQTTNDLDPPSGHVVVRTHAVGVNFADCLVRMGLYQSAKDFVGWPITPGFEFAGTVLSTGPNTSRFHTDQPVFGVSRFSAYASQVSVPESQLFPIPDAFDMPQAATFPVVFLTAYYALFHLANIHPPQNHHQPHILVHSAAGGVGSALLQLASLAPCRITGVVGHTAKVQTARSFGAHNVIDKSRENLWNGAQCYAPNGYDVVFDANGAETLEQSYQHLASPGKLVVYGFHSMLPRAKGKPSYPKLAFDYLRTPRFNPLDMTNHNKSVLAFNLSYLFHRQDFLQDSMSQLLNWVRDGSIRSAPVQTFPFERVADAHRAIESGNTVGKLALLL
ncbi:MAG: synaptic vesicle VAT-1 family membrane protein [Myxococcota bacterium]